MRSTLIKLSLVPVLGLSLVLAACENTDGPDGLLGPQASAPSFHDSEGGENGDSQSFRFVKGSDGALGLVTAIIGTEGGKLELGRHELKVPAGAVHQPTVFTMELQDSEHIRVRLTAVATDLFGNVIFTGAQGFDRPVKLELSYSWAGTLGEDVVEDLEIVWVRPDGSLDKQSSHVNEDVQEVETYLKHFSDYALVMP